MSSANNAVSGISAPWMELAAKLKEKPARAADSVVAGESDESTPVAAGSAPAADESADESNDRRSLSMLMRDTVATAAEILDADVCSVAEVVEGGTMLELEAFAANDCGDQPTAPQTHKTLLDASKSMVGYALNTTDAAVASSHAIENRFTDDWLDELQVANSLVIPLRLRSRPFGAIGIHRTRKDVFTPDDVHFAGTLAQSLISLVSRLELEKASREGRPTAEVPAETVNAGPLEEPGPQYGPVTQDLRSSTRHEYPASLMVAPTSGSLMPPRQGFSKALCHDISQGGLSFYWDDPPDFDTLIVELGMPGETTQLRAKVVYTRETDCDGKAKCLVGCRFTGRVYV